MENKAICRRVSAMLSLFIDNKVTYQERAFIEEHISNCKDCYKKYLVLSSFLLAYFFFCGKEEVI